MNTEEQQQQARHLYFQANLNQSEIAAEVGVSQKTISLWISNGRWNTLKEMSKATPAMMIDGMYAELVELNDSIHAREPGKRFATREEADIRRKLLLGIRTIQQQQSAASHMEVLLNFIEFLKRAAPGLTKEVTLIADDYLCGEKRLGQKPRFQPYDLPHQHTTEESQPQEPQQPQAPEQPIQQPPAPQPLSPNPSAPRSQPIALNPQPQQSPLLHPVTPQTTSWPPAKKKEKPKPKRKVPSHLKGEDRRAWINFMDLRDKLLGPDADDTAHKV